jgi:hypothetical protein
MSSGAVGLLSAARLSYHHVQVRQSLAAGRPRGDAHASADDVVDSMLRDVPCIAAAVAPGGHSKAEASVSEVRHAAVEWAGAVRLCCSTAAVCKPVRVSTGAADFHGRGVGRAHQVQPQVDSSVLQPQPDVKSPQLKPPPAKPPKERNVKCPYCKKSFTTHEGCFSVRGPSHGRFHTDEPGSPYRARTHTLLLGLAAPTRRRDD